MGTQLRIYLDWNATAPLREESRVAMLAALDVGGNPSSVHGEGRAARRIVEDARAALARLTGVDREQVIFTAGATEANVLALVPGLGAGGETPGCCRLLVAATEHPSVLAGGRFAAEAVETLPVGADGVIDLAALDAALERSAESGERPLVSVSAANNETGVLQPLREVAAKVHAAGGLLHVDAVQAAGRLSIEISAYGADLMTLSAHKMGGPQGMGALIVGDPALVVPPLIRGGAQEHGARAGTENVAGAAGFAAAALVAGERFAAAAAHMRSLRRTLEQGLRTVSAETVVFGGEAERLPNTVMFAVPGIRAETAVIALDLIGMAVSSGAACSSGKVGASHVLEAMGVEPALAAGAIRVSLGWSTREVEIERFVEAWRNCVAALGKQRLEHAA